MGKPEIGKLLGVSHEVGQLMSYWILPVSWMNVGFKLLVKFVQWFQLWKHQQNQSLEVKRATSRLARIGNVPSRTKARTTCLLRIG